MPTALLRGIFHNVPIRVSGSGLNRTDTRIVIWKRCPFKYQSCNGHRLYIYVSVIVLSLSVNVIQGVNNYRLQMSNALP